MKCTHRNFPDSLVQQYNFDTNTTGALAEATATNEPEAEAAVEPQAKVELEDVEPSDQPEEECGKSATDSSPIEAEDDSKKEREEPSIKTHPKTKKRHIIQEEEEEDPEEEPFIPLLSGKGKAKIATPPASEDEMEHINTELATAATRVTPTPAEAKQLLDIIAAITTEGQAADASTLTPPQQTPSQHVRTSPRQFSKRKGTTSKGTATVASTPPKQTRSVSTTPATPAATPLTSPVKKKTKKLSATSPQVSPKGNLRSESKKC
ncbi:histone H3.v1-like [Citrus clementina]|uniref:histone H3.v1-like n=1 Tax=Citrus clementina TaxID=85681 RepID=UPI000CECFEC8|nr:histone H3.v1-like [Citrus x clementina]